MRGEELEKRECLVTFYPRTARWSYWNCSSGKFTKENYRLLVDAKISLHPLGWYGLCQIHTWICSGRRGQAKKDMVVHFSVVSNAK